jgi:hypothetical protein
MSVHDNPENKKFNSWKALGISVAAVAGITAAKAKVIRGLFEDVVEINKTSVDPDFDCSDEYLLGFRIPCGDGVGPYDTDADNASFDISEFASDAAVIALSGFVGWVLVTAFTETHAPKSVSV